MTATPVGDDDTVEAPVVLQDLVQKSGIMTVVLVLVEVVGTHDSPCASFLHGSLEGREVDLVEGTVGYLHIHLMTVFLVVVQGIVLHAGSYAQRLQSLDIGHHHTGGEIGIFAHVLEVTATEGGAVDVHARTQNHALLPVECFLTQ